jgi:hypothetical protein
MMLLKMTSWVIQIISYHKLIMNVGQRRYQCVLLRAVAVSLLRFRAPLIHDLWRVGP